MLRLYGFSKVNAVARGHTRDLRVLWALEEMQLPFELAGMDHPAHDLNTEAYRRLSPFEQIPSIDDDGLVLSESATILVYLAKKSGRLIPGDRAGEAQVVRWCFAAMNSVEPACAESESRLQRWQTAACWCWKPARTGRGYRGPSKGRLAARSPRMASPLRPGLASLGCLTCIDRALVQAHEPAAIDEDSVRNTRHAFDAASSRIMSAPFSAIMSVGA